MIFALILSICLSLSCTRNPEKEGSGPTTGDGGSAPQAGDASAPKAKPGPQIMEAAASGDTVMVTALLDTGADVNTQSEFGVTPLMAASAKGHLDTVRVLLAQGADVSLKDKMGLTARTYAENSGHTAIVEALAAAGAQK